jgi:hypothetical protein
VPPHWEDFGYDPNARAVDASDGGDARADASADVSADTHDE